MSSDQMVHVAVRPGAGVVSRVGSGVLVVLPGGDPAVQQQLLDALQEACEGEATPGRKLARKLVGLLSSADPDQVPPFGACAPNDRGWAVILHQGVALDVQRASGGQRLSGHDASTWVDRIVDGGFDSLTLLGDGEEVGEVDTRFQFPGGIVPGGGITILASGDAQAATAMAPAAAAPALDKPAAQPAPAQPPPAAPAQPAQPAPAAPVQPVAQPAPAPAQPAAPAPAPAAPAAPPVEPATGAPPPVVTGQPVAEQTAAPAVAPPPQPVAAPTQPPTPVGDASVFPPAAEPSPDEPPTIIQGPSDGDAEPSGGDRSLPDEDVPFESVPLGDVTSDHKRDPLPVLTEDTKPEDIEDEEGPLVYGVLSPAGYFNHPDALYCAVTGVGMAHRTHVLVQRPRPPLGVLVADDGSTFTLTADYIVGREPERDPRVESNAARPLKLQDAERSLSRVHAEVKLQDWDVVITDRGSSNGTYILPRGGQTWKRLVADTPEKITPGTRVAFGKRVMTFESHHQVHRDAI